MKKLFLLTFNCIICTFLLAQPTIIDLTTGFNNGTPLAYGTNDNTWTVRLPNGSVIAPKVVTPYVLSSTIGWASTSCARWISPQPNGNGGTAVELDSGNYVYETTFNLCFIDDSARIELSFLGADNEFLELRFNNNPYSFNFSGTDDSDPLKQNVTLYINPNHLLIGQNKIAIKVRNRIGVTGYTASGMFLCGRFYSPGLNAGPDRTICVGQCVTIGPVPVPNTQYTWTNNATGQVVGTTAQITVCPTASLTTYRLTTHNVHNPCVNTDVVRVQAFPNNPAFTVTKTLLPGLNYYNCTATPVVTNANTIAGFGEMYIIEEVDNNNVTIPGTKTSLGGNPNPPCWWVYPNPLIFKGYYGTLNVATYSNCHLGVPGRFYYCRKYRITRGTWNAYCPWAQQSQFVVYCDSEPGMNERQQNFTTTIDKHAPDLNYLKPSAIANIKPEAIETVYPNPSNGRFTIATEAIGNGRIEVYSPSGKLLQRITTGKQTNTVVDLSGQPSGTYTAKIITGNKVVTEKLVLLQ